MFEDHVNALVQHTFQQAGFEVTAFISFCHFTTTNIPTQNSIYTSRCIKYLNAFVFNI